MVQCPGYFRVESLHNNSGLDHTADGPITGSSNVYRIVPQEGGRERTSIGGLVASKRVVVTFAELD